MQNQDASSTNFPDKMFDLIVCNVGINNFEVKRVLNDSFNWRFLNGTAFLNTFHIVYGFLPDWKDIIPEKYRVKVFGDIEERINLLSQSAGEFSVNVPMQYIEAAKR